MHWPLIAVYKSISLNCLFCRGLHTCIACEEEQFHLPISMCAMINSCDALPVLIQRCHKCKPA